MAEGGSGGFFDWPLMNNSTYFVARHTNGPNILWVDGHVTWLLKEHLTADMLGIPGHDRR